MVGNITVRIHTVDITIPVLDDNDLVASDVFDHLPNVDEACLMNESSVCVDNATISSDMDGDVVVSNGKNGLDELGSFVFFKDGSDTTFGEKKVPVGIVDGTICINVVDCTIKLKDLELSSKVGSETDLSISSDEVVPFVSDSAVVVEAISGCSVIDGN